jgi:hypothetical protein
MSDLAFDAGGGPAADSAVPAEGTPARLGPSVRVEVRRDDPSQARIVRPAVPEPADGQVVLEVERFALSANNITYARLGDTIGYWRFYPAAPGWGCVPAWGIGRVIGSGRAEIAVGRTVSGLFPMASHVVLSPGRVGQGGFDEDAAHRRDLPRLYNVYRWTTETGHDQSLRLVLQPSLWLSFLLQDFLSARSYFDAGLVVISSASSKVALGLAFLLQRGQVRTIGLTAAARVPELRELELFDQVVGYDAIGSLARGPAVFVDLTGNPAVLTAVHDHFGSQLGHSALAGTTHGSADPQAVAAGLAGPVPQLFFVPDYLLGRASELGMDVLAGRFDDALGEFARWSRGWLQVQHVTGTDAVLEAYQRTLAGGVPVSAALICSLVPAAHPG